jgi:hypothetical protein
MDNRGNLNAEAMERMLDDTVSALLYQDDPVKAWKLLVNSKDMVGIKATSEGRSPRRRKWNRLSRNAFMRRIELVKLNWQEEVLI